LNSSLIQISEPENDSVILDKILINLHMISVEAKQNDDSFFNLLQNKMNSVFELFEIKEKLVSTKLKSIKKWESIVKKIYKTDNSEVLGKSIKSISFFGLNEAVLNHCGIELDRTKNSEEFALKTLVLMKNLIEEKNQCKNSNYILSQPHRDSYIRDSWFEGMTDVNPKVNEYSTNIIRTNSNLSLEKKMSLFKKFEKIVDGGTLFIEKIPDEMTIQEYIKTLFQSKIEKFSLRDIVI
jgi:anaerobic ribonucleoside-triphosphate reductase